MEVVWKDVSGRWYKAIFIRPSNNIVGKKQIYSIGDVKDIDSYEHISKKTLIQSTISAIQDKIGTTDSYVKYGENDIPKNNIIPQEDEWVCKTCVKLCKSKIVKSCSYYKGPNGGDSWTV